MISSTNLQLPRPYDYLSTFSAQHVITTPNVSTLCSAIRIKNFNNPSSADQPAMHSPRLNRLGFAVWLHRLANSIHSDSLPLLASFTLDYPFFLLPFSWSRFYFARFLQTTTVGRLYTGYSFWTIVILAIDPTSSVPSQHLSTIGPQSAACPL